jgi:hypothetical protein
LRLHYYGTRKASRERILAHRAVVFALRDERCARMWEFYLRRWFSPCHWRTNLLPAQRAGLMPTGSMRGGANDYRKGASIVERIGNGGFTEAFKTEDYSRRTIVHAFINALPKRHNEDVTAKPQLPKLRAA